MNVPDQPTHGHSNNPTSAKSHMHFLSYELGGGQKAPAVMGM